MTTNYTTQSIAGANTDKTTATQQFPLGTLLNGTNGTQWVYVQAAAAHTQYDWVSIDSAFASTSGTKTLLDKLNTIVGFAQIAFAITEYGWVALRGSTIKVRVKGATAVNTALYSTSVAGVLGTATTSQSKIFRLATVVTGSTSTSGKSCVAYMPGRE